MLNRSTELANSDLLDLALILNSQTDFDEILRLVAHKTTNMLRAESTLIMMLNPSTQETINTVFRQGRKIISKGLDSAQRQITGWLMDEERTFISGEIKQDRRFTKLNSIDLPLRSVVAVLLKAENLTLGSIVVFRSEKAEPFTNADLSLLEYIAVIAAPYLRNVEKIKEFFSPNVPESALLKKYTEVGLLGADKKFVELLQAVEAAARCDVRVVLEGESGTGKELIARAIHRFSSRSARPFIAVDCGAIPEHLLESELFGHKKGAFTGATQDRKGLFEEAEGGTLFIDEIVNLPLDMQSKFMRVLQESEVRPLGANRPKKVNVRVVSASSQPLRKLVEAGQFREDLFFRLHVYPIYVPSLQERDKDIALLANHFLGKFSEQQSKPLKSFRPDTMRFMKHRAWKGNIRELENFVERLVTLASSKTTALDYGLLPNDLKDEFNQFALQHEANKVSTSLKERLHGCEEQIIRQALIESDWNQSKAARSLKISEQIIRYRMKKLGIAREKSQFSYEDNVIKNS